MKGRRPKPVEQKIAEGNPGKRPLPEPLLVGGRLTEDDLAEPPADLPADAKRLWRRDVSRLVEVGIADKVDVAALEALCVAYARAKQAGRVVAKVGLFGEGAAGQLKEHPAVKIERESWAWFQRMAEQYGLTPIARTRLGQAELHRRTLAAELDEKIGEADLEEVTDAEVVT